MKAGWEVKPLGEVCTRITDGSHFSPKTKDAGYPYITVRDLDGDIGSIDFLGCKFVDQESFEELKKNGCAPSLGDILFSKDGTVGKVARVNVQKDFVVLSSLAILTPDPSKVLSEFLFYVLGAGDFVKQAVGKKTGVAIRRIILKNLKIISIPIPPLEEQKRIVAVLDAAFEGLTRAKENAEANLQNARELFENALNSIVLKIPKDSNLVGCKKNLNELREAQTRKRIDKKFRGPRFSSLQVAPELPEGWLWSSPEQICSHIVDCLHSTPKWADSGEVCLRTTNFRANELDLSETRFVSKKTYQNRISRLEPVSGDVLYSREGGILGIACLHPVGLKACLGQRMMQFRLKKKYMLPEFFCTVLNSALILHEVRHLTGGAAAPHLNIGDIRQFPIPVPPLDQQAAIVQDVSELFEYERTLVTSLGAKLTDIADLRQSLLQKAFAGELT